MSIERKEQITLHEAQLKEVVLQSLTHQKGGVLPYKTAIECAVNRDLQNEWTGYLEQTENSLLPARR